MITTTLGILLAVVILFVLAVAISCAGGGDGYGPDISEADKPRFCERARKTMISNLRPDLTPEHRQEAIARINAMNFETLRWFVRK
jgi:hypothetical protein